MNLGDLGSAVREMMGRKRFVLGVDMACALVAETLLLVVVLNARQFWPVALLLGVTVVTTAAAMVLLRTYRQLWSRVSLADLVALAGASAIVSLVLAAASYWDFGAHAPIRVGTGSFFVLLAGWAGPRVLARLWWESQAQRATADKLRTLEPILLLGADRRASIFIKSNAIDPRYEIAGFFHADPAMKGRLISGVPGLGPITEMPEQLARLATLGIVPRKLVVTDDSNASGTLAVGLDHAARNGLQLCRLPDAARLVAGNESVRAVTIEDILHRDTISLARPEVPEVLRGARVLVTGAGGSIGSELVRQIASHQPREIVLVDHSEFNLYSIELELADSFPAVPRVVALVDVRDPAALDRLFAASPPDIVLHAAALKHVPMLEDQPDQAVLTNVLGTLNVARLAMAHGAAQFTMVSTDKAVNPTNVMGCTKRWAEMICQAHDAQADRTGRPTRFACVRFGNVLGSAGSVVPLFRRQIEKGGPITVTDPEITRYFMTIPEACELILAATATTMAKPQRDPRVFVLDMGEPVRIVSLAERMIQLHGLRPHEDIRIVYSGLRAGEKLYEELAHPDEQLVPAEFPRASLAIARTAPFDTVVAAAERLIAAAMSGDRAQLRGHLRMLVPEYLPDRPAAAPPEIAPVA